MSAGADVGRLEDGPAPERGPLRRRPLRSGGLQHLHGASPLHALSQAATAAFPQAAGTARGPASEARADALGGCTGRGPASRGPSHRQSASAARGGGQRRPPRGMVGGTTTRGHPRFALRAAGRVKWPTVSGPFRKVWNAPNRRQLQSRFITLPAALTLPKGPRVTQLPREGDQLLPDLGRFDRPVLLRAHRLLQQPGEGAGLDDVVPRMRLEVRSRPGRPGQRPPGDAQWSSQCREPNSPPTGSPSEGCSIEPRVPSPLLPRPSAARGRRWSPQAVGSESTNWIMRRRMASSGSRPIPPPRLSAMLRGRLVAGVIAVTAG
jgi:hypothetical protein